MIVEPDYLDFLKMLNKNEAVYRIVLRKNAPRFTGEIAAGRAQDIADVEKFQKLVSRKKGK